jgi:hypothetical protein
LACFKLIVSGDVNMPPHISLYYIQFFGELLGYV